MPFGPENVPALNGAPGPGNGAGWSGGSAFPTFSFEPIPVDPPAFTKKEQDEAMAYIAPWLRASRACVRQKEGEWRLLKLLYDDLAKVNDLLDTTLSHRSTNYSKSRRPTDEEDAGLADWQWDHAYGISHLIDRVKDELVPSVFDGPEWLLVNLTDKLDNNPEPLRDPSMDFPLAKRVQEMMLRYLRRGLTKNCMARTAKHWAGYGTGIVTVSWEQKFGKQWHLRSNGIGNYRVGAPRYDRTIIYEYPLISHIPIHKFLPDFEATNPDVQRWSGAGYRVIRSFDQVLAGFRQGRYNLNEEEFKKRFEFSGASRWGNEHEFEQDPDMDVDRDNRNFVQLWLWHGEVPLKSPYPDLYEVIAVIATECGQDIDADNGVLLLLEHGPIGADGMRPFFVSHYSPESAPFGRSLVKSQMNWIRLITEMQCRLIDGLRQTSNPSRFLHQQILDQLDEGGNYLPPGQCFHIPDGYTMDQLQGVAALPQFNADLIMRMLQYAQQELERGTITSVYQGMNSRSQTATEAQMLQAQSQRPVRTRTDDFVDTLLTPAINKCLTLAQFYGGNSMVMLPDSSGQAVPAQITEQELKSGKFEAVVTITRQDATRLAKAAAIERMLPQLMSAAPELKQEGQQISLAETIKGYFDLLGVDGSDRIVRTIAPQMKMLMDQNQQLQQQLEELQKGGNKEPAESINFRDLPPTGQVQMAAKAGIELTPQAMMGMMGALGGPSTAESPQDGPPPGGNTPEPVNNPVPPLAENGGPMGAMPTDPNIMAQLYQMQAQEQMPPEM